jgi:hypothetical protein
MEVLAAVALAGNVLQFAEFGIKLLTTSGELYAKGASIRTPVSRNQSTGSAPWPTRASPGATVNNSVIIRLLFAASL